MTVEKRWIRNGALTMSIALLIFVLAQIAITGAVNVLLPSSASLNSSIEFACISLFIMPSVWLGIAAAISRHRGVYITFTVFVSLSILSSIGFLVYEGYGFGVAGLYVFSAGSEVQGLMVSKLVCWSLITVILMVNLAFAIAGDCSRQPPEFKYVSPYNPPAVPMNYMPPEYARQAKPQLIDQPREYPRMVGPPGRYADYPSVSPRQYYTSRY